MSEPHSLMTSSEVQYWKNRCEWSLKFFSQVNNGNFATSISPLTTHAQCVNLARYSCCLRRGYGGTAPQESQSEVFLRKLAPWALRHYQTIPWAAYVAGTCLARGLEMEINVPHAVQVFRQGSECGHVQCKYHYALYILQGLGVEKNQELGIALLRNLADDEGDLDAASKLASIYEGGLGRTVAQDKKRAFQIYLRNVEKGHVPSMLQLATCYASGNGVEVDHAKVYELCNRAEKLGCVEAFAHLANCLICGVGVKANPTEGIAMLRRGIAEDYGSCRRMLVNVYLAKAVPLRSKAHLVHILTDGADRGDTYCMLLLANMYNSGNGVAKDKVQARALIKLASAMNDGVAGRQLAQYYEMGTDGPKDLEYAVQLYMKFGYLEKATSLARLFPQ